MAWSDLPTDITLRCLPYYLKGNDLISYARTCTQLYSLMFDDRFWHSLLARDCGHIHYSGRYARSVYLCIGERYRLYTLHGCIKNIRDSETELSLYLDLVRNSISSSKFSLKENVVAGVSYCSDYHRFRFFGSNYEVWVSNSPELRFDIVCLHISRRFYFTIYRRLDNDDLKSFRDLLGIIDKFSNSLTEQWILAQIGKIIRDLASRGIDSDVTYRRLQN